MGLCEMCAAREREEERRRDHRLASMREEADKKDIYTILPETIPGPVVSAIKMFLKFGDETTGKFHNGYYGKGGWPYEVLNKFIGEKP